MKKVYLVECLTSSWEIDSVHSSAERAMARYPSEVWQSVSERLTKRVITTGWNNGKLYEEALVILELKVDTEKEELPPLFDDRMIPGL